MTIDSGCPRTLYKNRLMEQYFKNNENDRKMGEMSDIESYV